MSVSDGGSERFTMFDQFADHPIDCAAQRPVALLLDDMHWAELSALRLLSHLIHRPTLPGVLIAVAVRTTAPLPPDVRELASGVLAHPATEVLELAGFDDCEIAAFTEQSSPRRLTDDEIAVLARRSGGNPFLLGELLRWVPSGGSAVALDAGLPLAVRESVRRRLVVEEVVTQQVVKAAAVAGSVGSLDLLARPTRTRMRWHSRCSASPGQRHQSDPLRDQPPW